MITSTEVLLKFSTALVQVLLTVMVDDPLSDITQVCEEVAHARDLKQVRNTHYVDPSSTMPKPTISLHSVMSTNKLIEGHSCQ